MLTPRASDSSSLLFVYYHVALMHFLLFTTSVGLPGSVSRTLVLTDALSPTGGIFVFLHWILKYCLTLFCFARFCIEDLGANRRIEPKTFLSFTLSSEVMSKSVLFCQT